MSRKNTRTDTGRQERQAFIEHLVLNPADVSARLVFADWLEERGEDELAGALRKPGPTEKVYIGCRDCPMPEDVTARLAFADWLEERGDYEGASLEREPRPTKKVCNEKR